MNRIVAILACGAAVACAGLPGPLFKVELKKAEDSTAITSTDNASVVTIISKSGIGGAKLVLTGTSWPTRLTIRLAVKGLESFRMDNGTIHFDTSLKSPKQVPYWKVGKNDQRPESPDGMLEVDLVNTGEAVEIVVPRELMDGNPEEISFEWIDFFRG